MKAETKRTAKLSEEDIQEAIAYWLTNVADMDSLYCAENVRFSIRPTDPYAVNFKVAAHAVAGGTDKA